MTSAVGLRLIALTSKPFSAIKHESRISERCHCGTDAYSNLFRR
jgi:hypothetical protein